MSTAGLTNAPMASARVYCEPFVYTSMVTKTVSSNGYRMVASGERLGRQAMDAVSDMSQRMVLLTQAVDTNHELFAYFTTGGAVPLVVFLRCTANLDWQGRPGGFCSGLAFRRDELAVLPGGSAHALDFDSLPFLTQDQIGSFLKSAGDQGRDGLVLKGLNLKAAPSYFRPGDRAHFASHLAQYLALARRFESLEMLHVRKDEDTWRTLRLVSLVLPAGLRADTSAMLGARRGLERVGRVQIWLDGEHTGSGVTNLLHLGSNAEGDPSFAAYLGEALNDPAISDEQIIAMLTPDPSIESVREFWTDVRQSQARQELARSRSLKGRPAAEVAATFASMVRRAPDPAGFVAERFEAWGGETELLAAFLQMLRVKEKDQRNDAYKLTVAAMAEAVKSDASNQLRALLGRSAIWRSQVLREFWLGVLSDVPMPEPDEAMLMRVLELDDATARAWLEKWVPQHPVFFLQARAFRNSAVWAGLGAPARRALYDACLQAADSELRVLAVKTPALSEFISPRDLEFFDPAAFGDARAFVHRFEETHSPAELFDLWQAALTHTGYEAMAKPALWALVDALPKLNADARLAVLRAVRADPQGRGGPTSLHYRASQVLEQLRQRDPAAYEVAARELMGGEAAAGPAVEAPAEKPAWSESISPAPRKGKGILIAVAAGLVVAVGGVGVFIYLQKTGAAAGASNAYLADKEFEDYQARKNK